MTQLRLVWELARKDLLLFAADRRGMLLCFGVPILLASVFGAIFHRPAAEQVRPRLFVVPGDASPLSARIVQGLRGSEHADATTGDADSARRWLAGEPSGVVVHLPAGLGRLPPASPPSGPRPVVRLHHAPGAHLESQWAEGIVTQVVLREMASAYLAPLGKAVPLDRPFGVERHSESAGGALSVNAYSHSFCGMTLQYLLFWGMDSGLMLLRERRQGIWRRLRAAPVSPWTLLMGKALATALVAAALIALTFAFGAVCFGVTVTGSVAGFLLMACAAALLSAATGMLVAALGGNEGRARSVSILLILTLSLLGGLWLPAFLLPAWAQRLALLLPTTWAARGLEGVTWQGMDLAGAWPCALALVGYSVAFLAFACWRLACSSDRPDTEGGKTWVG